MCVIDHGVDSDLTLKKLTRKLLDNKLLAQSDLINRWGGLILWKEKERVEGRLPDLMH